MYVQKDFPTAIVSSTAITGIEISEAPKSSTMSSKPIYVPLILV